LRFKKDIFFRFMHCQQEVEWDAESLTCVGPRVPKPREMKVLSLLRAVPQKEMNQILQEVTNVIKL